MRTMGVTKKLFALVSALALVALLVAGGLSWSMRSISKTEQQRQARSAARVESLLALISQSTRIQSAYQNLVRERDPDKLEALLALVEKGSAECRQAVEKAGLSSTVVGKRMEELNTAGGKVKEAVLKGDYAPAQQTMIEDSAPAFQALLDGITEVERESQKQARLDALADASSDERRGIATSVMALIAILALLGVAAVVLRRVDFDLQNSVHELDQASTQMANAAGQVSSASQDLARGASQQAASIEETSASSQQMQSMTQANAESAQSVSGLMSETAGVVDEANRKLEQLLASMQAINASGGKISKIIKVIDEIAFQTNILALNAAVEAARAGEMGLGFAVVADEVRNLAHRSAQAAGDTTNLIQESISLSREGATRLDEVADAIRNITERARQAQGLAAQVSAGSGQQTAGIDQMSTALSNMQQTTQGTAAAAEESAAAAEQMSAQCESMLTIVDRLRTLVQ